MHCQSQNQRFVTPYSLNTAAGSVTFKLRHSTYTASVSLDVNGSEVKLQHVEHLVSLSK